MTPVILCDARNTTRDIAILAVPRYFLEWMIRTRVTDFRQIMFSDDLSRSWYYFVSAQKPVSFMSDLTRIAERSCAIFTEPINVEFCVASLAFNGCLCGRFLGTHCPFHSYTRPQFLMLSSGWNTITYKVHDLFGSIWCHINNSYFQGVNFGL